MQSSEYYKFLKQLADNNINQFFLNTDLDKALDVYQVMFEHAEKSFRIYCGCLGLGDKPQFVNSLTSYLEKGGHLDIILTNYDSKGEEFRRSPVFPILSHYSSEVGSVRIHRTISDDAILRSNTNDTIHFSVGDEKMYRIETKIDERKAIGNMNDADGAEPFVAYFDQMFNNPSYSTAIPLQ